MSLSRKLAWPNNNMGVADCTLKSSFTEEMLKEHIFIVQWKRTLLFFWNLRNFLIIKKTLPTFLSYIYTLLTTSLLKTEFVFIHLSFHRLSLTILEYTNSLLLAKHENGILIFYSQFFSDHQLHVFSILLFDCKVQFF